jgi:uracil-DNA glycosylase
VSNWDALNAQIVACTRCPRLVAYRERVAQQKRAQYRGWDYWGKPVPNFGEPTARLLIVGLAPAAHGGNRTGRIFTGDASGDFLFAACTRWASATSRPQYIATTGYSCTMSP